MNYYSCKKFEKKIFFFRVEKKINFYELLSHKRYEKNIFISIRKFLYHQPCWDKVVFWIKVWFHLVRQIVWAQNQFIKMVNWKIYHWKINGTNHSCRILDQFVFRQKIASVEIGKKIMIICDLNFAVNVQMLEIQWSHTSTRKQIFNFQCRAHSSSKVLEKKLFKNFYQSIEILKKKLQKWRSYSEFLTWIIIVH